MNKKIARCLFILLVLFCQDAAASDIKALPALRARGEISDYVEGLSGQRPKAVYVSVMMQGQEKVGAAYILDFANNSACNRAYRAFVARDKFNGALDFKKSKFGRSVTVLEGIGSTSCVAKSGGRLIYARAKDTDVAFQGLLVARVKGEGTRKVVNGIILIALAAGAFFLIRHWQELAIPDRIKVWAGGIAPRLKSGPRVKIGPQIKLGPKVKVSQEGPKINIEKKEEGPQIKFDA